MTRVLLAEDDTRTSTGLATLISTSGHDVLICPDAEAAQVALESEEFDTFISDVKLSGPFRFEGLDLLSFATRVLHAPRLIGMSGSNAEGLPEAVRAIGAAFLLKPFPFEELEVLLGEGQLSDGTMRYVPPIHNVVAGPITPIFQPVVRMSDERVIAGFEALTRLEIPLIGNPVALFRYAHLRNESIPLNLKCVESAVVAGAPLARDSMLFVNVDGRVFSGRGELERRLLRASDESGLPLSSLVLELTEQHPFPEEPDAFAAVERLREMGVLFAFDDVGIAYSHLPFIDKIRPAFLKISQQFGTSFETDPTRRKLVQNVIGLAREFGCEVILEGIESEPTWRAAAALGIELGQGFHFSAPQRMEHFRTMS